MADIIEELSWRGLLAISTDLDELRAALASGPVTAYGGFDPTAPGLHIGNLVLLITLRRLQLAGHRPIAVAGGATGLVGDPGGKSEERTLLSPEELRGNTEGIHAQLRSFLELDGSDGADVQTPGEVPYRELRPVKDRAQQFDIALAEPAHAAGVEQGGRVLQTGRDAAVRELVEVEEDVQRGAGERRPHQFHLKTR